MIGRWQQAGAQAPLVLSDVRADSRTGRAAVLLDRDGVLNEARPDPGSGVMESPLNVQDVRLLPGVPAALGELARVGFALVCVSNQPAAAKGKVTVTELCAIHDRVLELLAAEGARLDASYLCPHHPEGIVRGLTMRCACRKPAPGMLREAGVALELDLRASWMLGDTDADVSAGQGAGSRTALIEYPGTAHKRSGESSPDLLAADLPDAAAQVRDQRSR